MQGRLPVEVDPFLEARRAARFRGRIPLSSLPRLVAATAPGAAQIEVELAFDVDEQGRTTLTGRAAGELELTCQRCLEPMSQAVVADFRLTVVASESDARELASDLEPLVVSERRLRLEETVEDEMLLVLPLVPMHESGPECRPHREWNGAPGGQGQDDGAQHPFAVLADMKKQ